MPNLSFHDQQFEGKVFIVTGGSTGIGAATVKSLIESGASVFNLDLVKSPTLSDAEKYQYIHCDVSKSESVSIAIKDVMKQSGGKLNGLFSNAGIHFFGTIEDTDLDTFRRVLDVNFSGTFYVLKEVIPILKKNGSGSIVLMGSDQSLIGKGASAIYGATKGAIGQLTKSLAIDYAEFGIRVNCVCPGTIETPLYHNAVDFYCKKTGADKNEVYSGLANSQPIKRVGKPEEVSNLVLFLLSDQSSFMTGGLVSVDGGYVAQ